MNDWVNLRKMFFSFPQSFGSQSGRPNLNFAMVREISDSSTSSSELSLLSQPKYKVGKTIFSTSSSSSAESTPWFTPADRNQIALNSERIGEGIAMLYADQCRMDMDR